MYVISADCFISGFTASQSTLFCGAKYSVLHFAYKPSVLLRIFPKFFSPLCIEKHSKKHFQLVSVFIYLPPSFYFFAVFVLMSPQKDNYLSLLILESFSLFAGVFRKSFLPLTIIGKLQAVCWGISRKFYKNFSAIIGFLQIGT